MDEWASLTEPWRACLQLAWDAYRARTIPVGAVVLDASGTIVARGRNRIREPHDGGLAGTRLAHAEIAALAQLPSSHRYEDHTLYSALEPCLLCVGATTLSKVGSIRYLAADPYGGACSVEIDNADFRRSAVAIDGPAGGWPAHLSAALQAAFWLGEATPVAASIVEAFGPAAASAGDRIRALDGDVEGTLEHDLPALLELL